MPTIVETEVGGNRDLVAGNGLGVLGAATRAIGNAAARRRVKQFRDGSWWIPFRSARSRCSNICIPLPQAHSFSRPVISIGYWLDRLKDRQRSVVKRPLAGKRDTQSLAEHASLPFP